MPELPEVETIVLDLKKEVLNRTFINFWTDFKKMVKKPKDLEKFKELITGEKIKNIRRRGKNILIDLSQNKTLLIHQKLTGHLLLGKWRLEENSWVSDIPGPLAKDPVNKFLHLIFFLDNGRQLALSDLRKFAKVELWEKAELENSKEFKSLGPEPLDKDFTFKKFKERLQKKKKLQPPHRPPAKGRPLGKIKQVLMDQTVIAGIGNIYSDEILWEAKIHPFKDISKLSEDELKKIYQAMEKILPKAIKLGGESISDFRRITGEKGYFDKERKAYRREGEKCQRCGTTIKRLKIGGRSAHFCPKCQPR